MLKNSALFLNGNRVLRNVDIDWDDQQVRVLNRSTHKEMMSYDIVETAASSEPERTMAWDIKDDRGNLVRLVAQTGCGCSGMRAYENDETYSGALKRK